MLMKTKDNDKKSRSTRTRSADLRFKVCGPSHPNGRTPLGISVDSRFRGNDQGQSGYRMHVIPAKAGIHFSGALAFCNDFDAAVRVSVDHLVKERTS